MVKIMRFREEKEPYKRWRRLKNKGREKDIKSKKLPPFEWTGELDADLDRDALIKQGITHTVG